MGGAPRQSYSKGNRKKCILDTDDGSISREVISS